MESGPLGFHDDEQLSDYKYEQYCDDPRLSLLKQNSKYRALVLDRTLIHMCESMQLDYWLNWLCGWTDVDGNLAKIIQNRKGKKKNKTQEYAESMVRRGHAGRRAYPVKLTPKM